MKTAKLGVLLFVFFGSLGVGAQSLTHYPDVKAVNDVPGWYADFFKSMKLEGQYYASAGSVDDIAVWYQKSGQYTVFHTEPKLTIVNNDTSAIIIQDKSRQLDADFRKHFPKTSILHIQGNKEAVDQYIGLFKKTTR